MQIGTSADQLVLLGRNSSSAQCGSSQYWLLVRAQVIPHWECLTEGMALAQKTNTSELWHIQLQDYFADVVRISVTEYSSPLRSICRGLITHLMCREGWVSVVLVWNNVLSGEMKLGWLCGFCCTSFIPCSAFHVCYLQLSEPLNSSLLRLCAVRWE